MSKYFIAIRHENCSVHNSTICTCKLNIGEEELMTLNRQSLDFYKLCNTVFEIVNGRITYLSVQSKIEILIASNN